MLLIHSVSTISFGLRVCTEVLASSGFHRWALSLLVAHAQKPVANAVSPAPTKKSTTCGTLCWIRSSNTKDPCCCLTSKTQKQHDWFHKQARFILSLQCDRATSPSALSNAWRLMTSLNVINLSRSSQVVLVSEIPRDDDDVGGRGRKG